MVPKKDEKCFFLKRFANQDNTIKIFYLIIMSLSEHKITTPEVELTKHYILVNIYVYLNLYKYLSRIIVQ